MSYMCMECRAIHPDLTSARECCQPRVESIADDWVAPCQDGGENCDNLNCVFCQGTGLMLKLAPEVRGLDSQKGQECTWEGRSVTFEDGAWKSPTMKP